MLDVKDLVVHNTSLGLVAYDKTATGESFIYFVCLGCGRRDYFEVHSQACSRTHPVVKVLVPAIVRRIIDAEPHKEISQNWLPILKEYFPELM